MTSFIKKDGAYKGFKEEVWAELSSSEMNNIKYKESKERKGTAQQQQKNKSIYSQLNTGRLGWAG